MIEKKDIVTKEIEQTERQILADKYMTALKKVKFINELKRGLGEEIKANPKAKVIKKTWSQRVKERLKKILTKF